MKGYKIFTYDFLFVHYIKLVGELHVYWGDPLLVGTDYHPPDARKAVHVKHQIEYQFEQPQACLHIVSRLQELYNFVQPEHPPQFEHSENLNPLGLLCLLQLFDVGFVFAGYLEDVIEGHRGQNIYEKCSFYIKLGNVLQLLDFLPFVIYVHCPEIH